MAFFLLLLLSCVFVLLGANAQNKTTSHTNKRGLAFPSANNPGDVLNVNQSHSQITWVYDWGLTAPPYLASSHLEYIPMQWGAGNIQNLAAAVKAQGAKTILFLNEPDFSEQSNVDPLYAAQLWQEYVEPLKALGVRLGGPAVTSSGTGQPWLTQFLAACSNCTIDFLPVHWYGSGVQGFYDYLWHFHGQFNYTVWVTEFADTSLNSSDVATFMNQSTKYLDELDWVERYAWFGLFRPENTSAYNLMDEDGGLNKLGSAYIGADTIFKSGKAAVPTTVANGGGPTKALSTVTVPTDGRPPTITPNGGRGQPSPLREASAPLLCLGLAVLFSLAGAAWAV